MATKKYVFRWKEDGAEVRPTWDYSKTDAWVNARAICRPASMKGSNDSEVDAYLREHGEVVEMET